LVFKIQLKMSGMFFLGHSVDLRFECPVQATKCLKHLILAVKLLWMQASHSWAHV